MVTRTPSAFVLFLATFLFSVHQAAGAPYTCPAGMTASEQTLGMLPASKAAIEYGQKFLRIRCDQSVSTWFAMKKQQLGREFTIQIWVKHMGCVKASSPIRTLLFAKDRFKLIYNTTGRRYQALLSAGKKRRWINGTQDVVAYNKWVNLVFICDPKSGVRLYKNRQSVVLSGSYMDLTTNTSEYIYVGSTDLPDVDRFDGYIDDGTFENRAYTAASALSQICMYQGKWELIANLDNPLVSNTTTTPKTLDDFREWTDGNPALLNALTCSHLSYDGMGFSSTSKRTLADC